MEWQHNCNFHFPDTSEGKPHFPAMGFFSMLSAFVIGAFKLLVCFVFGNANCLSSYLQKWLKYSEYELSAGYVYLKDFQNATWFFILLINSSSNFQSCLNFKLSSFRSLFYESFSLSKVFTIQCHPPCYLQILLVNWIMHIYHCYYVHTLCFPKLVIRDRPWDFFPLSFTSRFCINKKHNVMIFLSFCSA